MSMLMRWGALFFCFAVVLYAEMPLEQLSLLEAETLALEHNKQLLIAKERTIAAKERQSQAVSQFLPSLSYSAEFRDIEREELFFNVFSDHFLFSHRGYSSIFELKWPLFSTDLIFGLKSKSVESEASLFEQAHTRNELLLAVRKSYYAVIFFEKALTIERENIRYLEFALEQEQGKLEAGSSTSFEVNQSKVAVANAISLYYLTLKELKNARNALILNLGLDPLLEPKMQLSQKEIPLFSIPEISLKLQEIEQRYHYSKTTFPTTRDFIRHIDQIDKAKDLLFFSEQEVLHYLEEALKRRPDLRHSKLQIHVATEHLREKQGHYLPKISSYVRYSYNDIDLGTVPFGSQEYFWSGGIKLSWNLFDSLLREHEIKEAHSKRQATHIHFDQTTQKIEVEIRNGLYQLEESLLTYLSSTQAVYLAEEARQQAQDKLCFGRIAPLEYRDAVNLLSQARNQRNRASFELIAAFYQLRYATGADSS